MSAPFEVRVTVLDNWEEVTLPVSAATPVAEVKQAALASMRIRRPASEYMVKYKGAEVDEGKRTLAEAGVTPNGALIVLRRRRVPAR